MDKLGERLALKLICIRIYGALVTKVRGSEPLPGGPTVHEVLSIRDEELFQRKLIESAIEKLGGDRMTVTPSAELTGIICSGIPLVLADPRSTLRQSLDAILLAELADNDGWQLLVKICEDVEEHELAAQFRLALRSEAEHLESVRRWIEKATLRA